VSPAQVYRADLQQLLSSDLVVAYIGSPSLGVGAELALAVRSHIPVVALQRPGDLVSRFVVGMLDSADARIVVTSDEELPQELRGALRSAIASVRAEQPTRRVSPLREGAPTT
jgi:hypothetical protein